MFVSGTNCGETEQDLRLCRGWSGNQNSDSSDPAGTTGDPSRMALTLLAT